MIDPGEFLAQGSKLLYGRRMFRVPRNQRRGAKGDQVGQASRFGTFDVFKGGPVLSLSGTKRSNDQAFINGKLVLEKGDLQLFPAKMAAQVLKLPISILVRMARCFNFAQCLFYLSQHKIGLIESR